MRNDWCDHNCDFDLIRDGGRRDLLQRQLYASFFLQTHEFALLLEPSYDSVYMSQPCPNDGMRPMTAIEGFSTI